MYLDKFKTTRSGLIKSFIHNFTRYNSYCYLYKLDGKGPTLCASGGNSKLKFLVDDKILILNPLEHYLYMGFTKNDYEKVIKSNATTVSKQIYASGNSISIEVLRELFRKMIEDEIVGLPFFNEENLKWFLFVNKYASISTLLTIASKLNNEKQARYIELILEISELLNSGYCDIDSQIVKRILDGDTDTSNLQQYIKLLKILDDDVYLFNNLDELKYSFIDYLNDFNLNSIDQHLDDYRDYIEKNFTLQELIHIR